MLENLELEFDKNFPKKVFPLGSANRGGKSTLLQLIFVFLHFPAKSELHFAIKNLLEDFTVQEEKQEILYI